MKKRIVKIVIAIIVVGGLIALASWLSLPVEHYHVQLHRNVFDNTAYTDENGEKQLPFEVMIADFAPLKTTTGTASDSVYTFSLLLQQAGNNDPEKITSVNLHHLQTDTYLHHDIYVDDFFYDETTDQLIAFLCVERRRYQLVLSWLGW